MRRASQVNIKNNQTTKKLVTLAFLICFIIVSLLTEAFILTHADHEHDHDGANGSCTTCVLILNAENLLKQFSTAVSGASYALINLFAAIAMLFSVLYLIEIKTPVKLKTRMNN